MNRAITGVIWGLAFVMLEAVQYVYFGNLFQRMSSLLFGSLVFGITTFVFVGWSWFTRPGHVRIAFANPVTLIAVNVFATLAWAAYLTSVQLIEPAVAYTIGSGTMPVAAYLAYRFGVREGEAMRNRTEAFGIAILLCAIIYLVGVTVSGHSGFVRGGLIVAATGVLFAIADGALFTWMLIYCQRLDRAGVGPGAVFGLRFPLYVLTSATLVVFGVDQKTSLAASDIVVTVLMGLALIIPPLYALQRAVSSISTMTIGALTALGPFVIFVLQMVEGRVDYSPATFAGLFVYFAGALLTAYGAVRASVKPLPPS